MTDREMLELAAKAAGLKIHARNQAERDATGCGHVGLWIVDGDSCWNPRDDDGQSMRLAGKINANITFGACMCPVVHVRVWGYVHSSNYADYGNDQMAAVRLAILRAAAEIGKAMP